MIHLLSEVGPPEAMVAVVFGAIASAVTCGAILGVVICWLTSAVEGGE